MKQILLSNYLANRGAYLGSYLVYGKRKTKKKIRTVQKRGNPWGIYLTDYWRWFRLWDIDDKLQIKANNGVMCEVHGIENDPLEKYPLLKKLVEMGVKGA